MATSLRVILQLEGEVCEAKGANTTQILSVLATKLNYKHMHMTCISSTYTTPLYFSKENVRAEIWLA